MVTAKSSFIVCLFCIPRAATSFFLNHRSLTKTPLTKLAIATAPDEDELLGWEKQEEGSAQPSLDLKRIQMAFDGLNTASLIEAVSREQKRIQQAFDGGVDTAAFVEAVSKERIPIAAAGTTAGTMLLASQSTVLSLVALGIVFFVAKEDPNEEGNTASNIARLFGCKRMIQPGEEEEEETAAIAAMDYSEGAVSQVQNAIAVAGFTTGSTFMFVTHQIFLSYVALCATAYAVQQDPVGESSLAGQIAGFLERTTIQSTEEASESTIEAGYDYITTLLVRLGKRLAALEK